MRIFRVDLKIALLKSNIWECEPALSAGCLDQDASAQAGVEGILFDADVDQRLCRALLEFDSRLSRADEETSAWACGADQDAWFLSRGDSDGKFGEIFGFSNQRCLAGPRAALAEPRRVGDVPLLGRGHEICSWEQKMGFLWCGISG